MSSADIDPAVRSLARFVHGLRAEHIPDPIAVRARHLVLDAIGCAMAARGEAFAGRFWSATAELAGDAGSRGVIGYVQRLPLRDAALMNGVLMHGLDYDDTHIAGVVHLTVGIVPALLPLASQLQRSGAELMTAYVAGVEAGARLAMAARGGFHAQGFHPTGVIGTFAAAWACGHLMRLDEDQLVHAQGIALSLAAGSLQFIEDGAWTKRLHAGWAAQAGIVAATQARHGIVAPQAPYSGRYGLFHAYLDEARRSAADVSIAGARLPFDANGAWELPQIAVKPFAMCHFVHAAIDAAIALRQRGVKVDDIRDIEVLVPPAAVPLVCEPQDRKRRPHTDYDAKFSLPYSVACGLMRGRLTLEELEPEAYSGADVQSLMDRVRYAIDPASGFPRHYSAEVRLTMADGSEHRHREAINRGHADRPMSNAEVHAKFVDNAGLHFSADRVAAVAAMVLGLDTLGSVENLEDLLAGAPDTSATRPDRSWPAPSYRRLG